MLSRETYVSTIYPWWRHTKETLSKLLLPCFCACVTLKTEKPYRTTEVCSLTRQLEFLPSHPRCMSQLNISASASYFLIITHLIRGKIYGILHKILHIRFLHVYCFNRDISEICFSSAHLTNITIGLCNSCLPPRRPAIIWSSEGRIYCGICVTRPQ